MDRRRVVGLGVRYIAGKPLPRSETADAVMIYSYMERERTCPAAVQTLRSRSVPRAALTAR